jgi:aminoglycoside 6'-N-acetyltransferase
LAGINMPSAPREYLKLLAERLGADGASAVAIDPAVGNLRARRAYEKAGFRGEAVAESGEGPAVLMLFGG